MLTGMDRLDIIDTESARFTTEPGGTDPDGQVDPSRASTVSAPVAELALWAWTRGGTVHRSADSAALDALLAQGMR